TVFPHLVSVCCFCHRTSTTVIHPLSLHDALPILVGGAGTLALMGEPTFLGDPDMVRTIGMSVVALVLWALVGVGFGAVLTNQVRSEEHTSELQSRENLVCRLLLEKKKQK